jgi:SAM-dependent methyltransferase
MDEITAAVRAMYEAFPYPAAGAPQLRTSTDARLLLSYGVRSRQKGQPLHVLDAGCGRGVGLLGAATLQPDVRFVGIDLNRVALAEATAEAARRKLGNVTFQEVDLMTLDGLSPPPGGFDVIYSSGVVHHLADPRAGLTRLAAMLAPHGVLALMVYGHHGRESVYRLARAIDRLCPRDRPLAERLEVLRAVVRQSSAETIEGRPFTHLAQTDDAELVDRYLNVNENSYDVPALFALVQESGLRFLRWSEPAEWAVEALFPAGPLLDRALKLPALAQFALVDELRWRPRLELIVARPENEPRFPPPPEQLATTMLAVSPEVSFQTSLRNLRGDSRVETFSYQLRANPPVAVTAGFLASALLLVRDQTRPFRGDTLTNALQNAGATREQAASVVWQLVAGEILYCPHPADV